MPAISTVRVCSRITKQTKERTSPPSVSPSTVNRLHPPRVPGSLRDSQRSPSAPASRSLPCLRQQLAPASSAREQPPHPTRRPAALMRPHPGRRRGLGAPSPLSARRL